MAIQSSPPDAEHSGEDYEVIAAPKNLQQFARKTPGDNKLDLTVLVKAEAALQTISGDYAEWMNKEIALLRETRADIQHNGLAQDNSQKLFYLMQNLRDCGTTFGFPYAAKIAASLCDVIEQIEPAKIPREIVDNHINAIFAIVNENATGNNKIAGKLTERLTSVTKDYLGSLKV